ncbi:MAG: hypothetical protein LC740_12335, partial [Actinobacteria bacterium]|nr:hypothetical protein [Actinomycetota bacterium]
SAASCCFYLLFIVVKQQQERENARWEAREVTFVLEAHEQRGKGRRATPAVGAGRAKYRGMASVSARSLEEQFGSR